MENFQAKLNLLKFNKAFTMTIRGKEAVKQCVCIPIEDNYLFVSADEHLKATIYADINVNPYENGKSQYGDTHYLRLSVPKEVRDKMTEEQKKAIPFLGNMKPSPLQQAQSAEPPVNGAYAIPEEELGDMPF